jgi:predicted lipoprotein with Yx(FWY)xxD motif
MTRTRLLVALLCALVLAACGYRDDPSSEAGYGTVAPAPTPAPTPAPAPEPAGAVTAGETALGAALTDVDGRVLYAFTKDTDGTSSCYDDCAATWPALTVDGPVTAGDGVEVDWLATAERQDGTAQVTYKGMPLYRYAGDSRPGDVNGQGIGGVWFAVTPGGRLIRAPAAGSDGGADAGDSYP